MRTLFPGARLGNCLRHALNKLPKKLVAIASPVRKALRTQFHTLLLQGAPAQRPTRVCTGPTVTPLCRPRHAHSRGGQRRTRTTVVSGQESGLVCGARRPPDAGDQHAAGSSPQRHRPETVHDEGIPSSRWEPTGVSHGLAHLYNLIPYQRRALHAGQCGVEVEGGRVPTRRMESKDGVLAASRQWISAQRSPHRTSSFHHIRRSNSGCVSHFRTHIHLWLLIAYCYPSGFWCPECLDPFPLCRLSRTPWTDVTPSSTTGPLPLLWHW